MSRDLEGAIAAEALRIRAITTRRLEVGEDRPGGELGDVTVLCAGSHEPQPVVDDPPPRPRRALLRRLLSR